MDIFGYVVLALIAATVIYVIVMYNRLVNLKHNVTKAWSNIDVLLKQRHDELPKLIATCKEYMQYEQETLEKVIAARSRAAEARAAGDIGALGAAEGALRIGLGQLFALAEDYPDLKANETFQHLQARITGLENSIADRREFYNESVNLNNIGIEEFPDVLVARFFNFKPFQLLEFTSALPSFDSMPAGAVFAPSSRQATSSSASAASSTGTPIRYLTCVWRASWCSRSAG
jgi:LemA protein